LRTKLLTLIQVDDKKWQLRKEGLDSLLPLCKSPRIAQGDFNDLTRTLKKILSKDTNVVLVALSAQCLAGLARGLRGGFKIGAAECFPSILVGHFYNIPIIF